MKYTLELLVRNEFDEVQRIDRVLASTIKELIPPTVYLNLGSLGQGEERR